MRKLSEIVDDLIDGKMPSHEECYYALQVYRLMFNTEHRHFRKELLRETRHSEFIRKNKAQISFDMYKGALSQSPKDWVGKT